MNNWSTSHVSFSITKSHIFFPENFLHSLLFQENKAKKKEKDAFKTMVGNLDLLRTGIGFKINIARLECRNPAIDCPFFSLWVAPHLYSARQMCLMASREGHFTPLTEHLVNGSSVQGTCQLWNPLCTLNLLSHVINQYPLAHSPVDKENRWLLSSVGRSIQKPSSL